MAKKTVVSQEVRDHADLLIADAKRVNMEIEVLKSKAQMLCDEAKLLNEMADRWENIGKE